LQFPEVRHDLTWRDTVLYALGVGFGADPGDARQLRFLLEDRLQAVPTMANVLAHPGFWLRDMDTGIDWRQVVHGGQFMQVHRPLPVQGAVTGRCRVVALHDKGAGKGAVIEWERTLFSEGASEPLATLRHTTFCRGDGGFGGDATRASQPPQPPDKPGRAPDAVADIATLPQQALIYRLSGDLNPLHSDPEAARAAGFHQPILHGLCTFGVAGRLLMAQLCHYEPGRLLSIAARFSAPVFPGESVRVSMWHQGRGQVHFEAAVPARDAVVMRGGSFRFIPG